MFKVEDVDLNAIAQYLVERPYKEVAPLVAILQKLERFEDPELAPAPEPEAE